MDRLEEGLKGIMQGASVIGREFAYRILQSITGMSEDLKSSLLNLQGLEFIYEKQLFPELAYIFKHALLRQVTYESVMKRVRRAYHGLVADWLAEQAGEYPSWNFHKYLLDREGRVVGSYSSFTPPESSNLIRAIESLL